MSEVRLMKKLPCIKIDNMTAISSIMLTNNAQGTIISTKKSTKIDRPFVLVLLSNSNF